MGVIYGIEELVGRNEKYELVKKDVVETVDVCIVGSGAAGAVLAKELAESGKRVVLLEKGGYHEGRDMNQRDADMIPLLWKNSGFNFDDSLRIAIAQGCCLGGSTIINDAVCFDTPLRVQQEWNGLGANFGENEWVDNLKKVNEILHVSEVAEEELSRNNKMLREGARRLGLLDHRNNHRNCINCMQCGFCHLGCHYETKQNVLVTYIHQALQHDDSKMKVYCNCQVEKIEYKDGVVQGIEGDFVDIDGKRSYRIRVNSKIAIISAGAIASTKLLLKNSISQSFAGNGLCLHPGIQVVGDFDYEIKGNEGIPMAYTVHDFGVSRKTDETIKNSSYDGCEFLLESIFLPLTQFSIALSGSGIMQHRNLIQRFNNYSMAGIVVRDGNLGKVSLTSTGRASVTYEPGKKELRALAKGAEILAKMWFELGANKIIIPHRGMSIIEKKEDIPKMVDMIVNDPSNLLLGSAHPQSGNKIGKNPEDSVVDSDCKVHGFKNLFVCDASVFPTAVGVNPQISVMTVASIIAARINKNWDSKYSSIKISPSIGRTCAIGQPMYCLTSSLSEMFESEQTHYGTEVLVNSTSEKADSTNWSFDPLGMMITNNSHWKGIFPRNLDISNTLVLYFGGFWKRFTKAGQAITGITHPYEVGVFAKNTPSEKQIEGFGKVILLEYVDPPYNQFYDVLKIVDKDTILGKAFFGTPSQGKELMSFSMSRKYPFEFMDEEDHEMLYNRMKKPGLDSMVGIWEGQIVSDSAWTQPVFRFRYYFDNNKKLKNDYLFGGTLAGTAIVEEKEDHLEMYDATENFHDELRQVNENIIIGKYYYSSPDYVFNWLPEGLSFIHVDESRPSIYLPYVLKRVGKDSAFRNSIV